jgi:hypothetical protein
MASLELTAKYLKADLASLGRSRPVWLPSDEESEATHQLIISRAVAHIDKTPINARWIKDARQILLEHAKMRRRYQALGRAS